MPFIRTTSEDEATGVVADVYNEDLEELGYVPDSTKVIMVRPNVYEGWVGLVLGVRSNMDRRRYELVTLAAAQELRSSYCSLAHGKILQEQFMSSEDLQSVLTGSGAGVLDEADVAVMDLARQVARDACAVQESDIQRLRDVGLSDEEIADVVYAAAARCFFSKILDALGAEPDSAFLQLSPELREALTVGRPIATG